MRMGNAALAGFCFTLFWVATTVPSRADGAALTGQVTSGEEGAMEGVLVTAKKAGSTIAVTVVTGKDGRYSFPASRLEPGQYAIRIRAVGYDPDSQGTADVAADKTSSLDIRLRRTRNLSAQLTNAEWLQSMPGTPKQKDMLLNCVSCHTVERIVRSTHDPKEFMQVQARMTTYANQSVPTRPQLRRAERLLEERGDNRVRAQRERAEFLASINLSETETWSYDLKPMPRPTGAATRVIITEYDLPRNSIEPHDVIIAKDGMAYYTNFGEQNLGRLDPKTGKVTEIKLPELKKGWPKGSLGIRPDADGNLWFGMMYQGAIGRLDLATLKVDTFSLPPDMNKDMAQINMVRPESSGVDGKVWSQNNGFAALHRLDLKTGEIETIAPFAASAKAGENHNIYDIIPDAANNVYFTDFAQQHLGRVDAKTGQLTLFELPTKASAPRRGMIDGKGRIWFGLYRGNKIDMFDTKTETFKEWEMPTAWASPYDVTVDRNGEVWTGSMLDDRVSRLDPETGRFIEYLLPRETNIRRVFVDNTTTPVTFWTGNNHQGSIVKVEPLD
ncbi:MAG: carboxypeptidase regulatory-like domain-containing protein [Bradyrhizobiaceae bacterium]|nr:carboxypeptidase regulatory-like domain-containing protein [Bradyrhizobiaceae bacterium]